MLFAEVTQKAIMRSWELFPNSVSVFVMNQHIKRLFYILVCIILLLFIYSYTSFELNLGLFSKHTFIFQHTCRRTFGNDYGVFECHYSSKIK